MRDPAGWIGTYSGTKFWPLEPRVEEIHIEDIAHSLARQCRFNGHCERFYSVAEHSVEVSRVLGAGRREAGSNPQSLALWGLLHDAAETYLSDLVRPIKRHCWFVARLSYRKYASCEEIILRLVAERFGLRYPAPKEVEVADERMLATERQQLFDARQPVWDALNGIEPYPIALSCLNCTAAENAFLARFKELTANG